MSADHAVDNHTSTLQLVRQLRKLASPMEVRLWDCLRAKRCSAFKFRRQVPIGPFIVDFVCFETRLIIELDGDSHILRAAQDTERTEWLESKGYTVLRFTNAEVRDNVEGVFEAIVSWLTR